MASPLLESTSSEEPLQKQKVIEITDIRRQLAKLENSVSHLQLHAAVHCDVTQSPANQNQAPLPFGSTETPIVREFRTINARLTRLENSISLSSNSIPAYAQLASQCPHCIRSISGNDVNVVHRQHATSSFCKGEVTANETQLQIISDRLSTIENAIGRSGVSVNEEGGNSCQNTPYPLPIPTQSLSDRMNRVENIVSNVLELIENPGLLLTENNRFSAEDLFRSLSDRVSRLEIDSNTAASDRSVQVSDITITIASECL